MMDRPQSATDYIIELLSQEYARPLPPPAPPPEPYYAQVEHRPLQEWVWWILGSVVVFLLSCGMVTSGSTGAAVGGFFVFFLAFIPLVIGANMRDSATTNSIYTRPAKPPVVIDPAIAIREQEAIVHRQRMEVMAILKDLVIAERANETSMTNTRTNSYTQITVAKVQAKAQKQIAEFQAIQSATIEKNRLAETERQRQFDRDLLVIQNKWAEEEADRKRKHAATQAQLDRELTANQMMSRLQHEIVVITTKMKLENPGVEFEANEDYLRLQAMMTQLAAIEELREDGDERYNILMDEYRRGFNRSRSKT